VATNLQEALSSGTPAAAGAKPITMESLPEASIDVEGGASSLDIEGLGVKKSKDGLSAGTTSSTASISTEDFFADLLAETDFNNADSVFSFRNGVIERISETDPATLSSLTASSLTAPSQAAASSSASRPSPSGFDTLFGDSGDGDDAGEDASYGSLDSDSSGSFSEAEAVSSAYSDAERAGMAGVVGKGLGAMQGLASGRDFSAASLATSAISSTDFGAAYGAYSNISGLANNVSGIDSISAGLNAVNAAVGAIGAIGDVTDALSSGRSFSDIAQSAFDNIADVAQAAWSAIQDPAAALDAFGEMAQYGSINATNLSYDLPSGLASYSFDKNGNLNTPSFINMMMGLTPLSNAFGLSQKGLGAIGYKDAMSDRAASFATAFGSTPGFSANTAEATGISATSYGTLGAITDFSFDVPGMQSLSMQVDLSAIDATWSSLSIEDLDQASVVQSYLDYEEKEVANQALQEWGRSRAEALGLDPNSSTSSQEAAQAMASMGKAADAAYTDAMDQMGYGFSALSNVDEAFSTSDPAADRAEAAFAAQAYQSAKQEAMSSFSQSQSISDEAMASSFGAYAAMEALGALTEDIAGFAALDAFGEQVSLNFADLTQAEKNSIANSYSTTAQSAASLSDRGQAAAEGYNSQAPEFDVVEAMQQLGYDYISMNAFQDLDKKEALANQMTLNALNADNDESGFEGSARGSGGVDEGAYSDALNASLADMMGAGRDAAAAAAAAADAADAADAAEAAAGFDSTADEGTDGGWGGEGGGADCFVQGTLVLMAEGSTKAIEKVVVGDLVAGKDGKANKVEATHIKNPDIPFLYGFNGHKPFVTAYHPFMTKEGWGCFEPEKFKDHRPTAYQEIANEQGGKDLIKIENDCELLRSDNQWVLVEDIVVEGCDPNLTVYNLSVANDKTFVANNYIVHNKDSGKIICTAMNQMYGFGSYRNALWMKYQKSHMAAEEYELGYHKLVMPLVKKMPTNKTIRTALERVAKRRTINIRKELRGQKLPLYYRSMKYTVRPLFFAVGWLVKKKILSKVKV